jgi:hypothetical protein
MSGTWLQIEKRAFIPFALLIILGCQVFAPISASPSRDLEATLSLDKEVYSPGDSFTFTIRVSNKGDEWIDVYYYKANFKHSNLAWLGGDFTTEESDIDLYLEPGETKEYITTKTIPRQIPTWLNIFGDWEFTLILIDDEDNEYRSNTLRVGLR